MSKTLVIVESPAKAKTISKYLGSEYVVKSSVGHIRDLPTSAKSSEAAKSNKEKKITKTKKNTSEEKEAKKNSALIKRMGVDPYKNWQANYQILPGKEKVVAELKTAAQKADKIYLATDLDREGEAIAWHLREVIGGEDERYRRVVFNEITKQAIQQAFKQPAHINMNRVYAQQTRRFMDRVVGYMVSPLLWKKVARGLSAGRVQSVAVRLVVEREKEIKAFIPEEYWQLFAQLKTPSQVALKMEVTHYQQKSFKPVTEVQTQTAVQTLEKEIYRVIQREDKPTSSRPSAPYITSTLQQAASTRLGFGVKKTMMLAQRLYEAGYITYMRTDSTSLSQDALAMARKSILDNYGRDYLPENPNFYKNKENSQEAHEAIRPSNAEVMPNDLKNGDKDEQKLYQLIWSQFIACQMVPALYNSTTLLVEAEEYQLVAKGKTLRFDGWTRAQNAFRKNDDTTVLPDAAIGDVLTLHELLPSQHFTKPLARFNEASLVRELEKRGIGRPSTYASIISTIQDRGYVRVDNRRFYAEKMGEIVTDRLEENFAELMSYDFTSRIETVLDDIATAQADWKQSLDKFFTKFSQELQSAEKDPDEGGMRINKMVLIEDIKCPNCGRDMGIRTGSTGVFLGCSGYALPIKERCKQTLNLIPELEVLSILEGDDAEVNALRARRRCQKCDTAMDSYLLDTSRKLHICGNNPECDGYEIEQGEFRIKGYDGPIVECEKCGSEMHLKLGRFGKYMGCMNESCKNTRKILKNGEIAPPKKDPIPLPELKTEKSDAFFVLRDGASGIFLAANTFPKSRETRAPAVEELQRFKDRLPEAWHYLTEAPTKDNDGNRTVVRFSRKTKQQYIGSEKEGKMTTWSCFYINDKWVITDKKKSKKSD